MIGSLFDGDDNKLSRDRALENARDLLEFLEIDRVDTQELEARNRELKEEVEQLKTAAKVKEARLVRAEAAVAKAGRMQDIVDAAKRATMLGDESDWKIYMQAQFHLKAAVMKLEA